MIDSRMEIGSPVICADAVNLVAAGLNDIAGDSRFSTSPIVELSVRGPIGRSMASLHPSGGENDAFNLMVERDRLDKEVASRALLAGASLMIRSSLTGYARNGEAFETTFRRGGATFKVSSTHLVIAAGNHSGTIPGVAIPGMRKFRSSYSRSAWKEWNRHLMHIRSGRETRYELSRDNQLDTLEFVDMGGNLSVSRDSGSRAGRSMIVSGEVDMQFPEEPWPGGNGVIAVGGAAGLYDPFFMTGYREACISGMMAAESIMNSSGNPDSAASLYSAGISRDITGRMKPAMLLRKEIEEAADEGIENLLSYLSGFEFNEISVGEIFRVTSLKQEELREMLGKNH